MRVDRLKFDIIEGDGKMQGKRDMQGTQEMVGIDLSYVGLMTIVPPPVVKESSPNFTSNIKHIYEN